MVQSSNILLVFLCLQNNFNYSALISPGWYFGHKHDSTAYLVTLVYTKNQALNILINANRRNLYLHRTWQSTLPAWFAPALLESHHPMTYPTCSKTLAYTEIYKNTNLSLLSLDTPIIQMLVNGIFLTQVIVAQKVEETGMHTKLQNTQQHTV